MKKLFCLLIALFSFAWLPNQTVHAAKLHFSVSAQLPSNQVDTSVSYFSLKVAPGQTQTLNLVLSNTDTVAHRYRIAVNRANTNTNGEIDYTKHAQPKAQSLKADIEAMTPKPFVVNVAANQKKTVGVKLTTPKQAWSGLVLGGIQVTELDSGQTKKSAKGLTLTNEYAYVVGLALQESGNYAGITPKIALRSTKAHQLNYRNTITATLENTTPTPIHQLKLKVKVTKKGAKHTYIRYTKADMAMAPNSTFAFPISTNNTPLVAGQYQMDLTATTAGQKFHFVKAFTITGAQARKLNHSAVDQKQSPFHWLLVGAGIILGILILVVIILIILLIRQRRAK
jgi:hypothetical protein